MKKIVLFRHLPTIDDDSDIYTSNNSEVKFIPLRNDLILNGQSQLIRFLRENNIKQIFCSDNNRGIETANILFKDLPIKLNIEIDRGLNNILQPEWGGLHQNEVKKTELYKIWHSYPKEVNFLNGESLADVELRVDKLLKKIDPNGAILISHTTPMQVILCKILELDLNRIWAFKFNHYNFTVLANNILLKYNSMELNDIDFNQLRF